MLTRCNPHLRPGWACGPAHVSESAPFFLSTVFLWFLCPALLSPLLCSCQPPPPAFPVFCYHLVRALWSLGEHRLHLSSLLVKTCKFLKQGNKWSFSQFVFNGKSLPLGANMFSAPINTSYGEIRAEWLRTYSLTPLKPLISFDIELYVVY